MRTGDGMRNVACLSLGLIAGFACPVVRAAGQTATEPTIITVDVSKVRQEFQGMGCGSIFYTGHITSFAKRGKHELQRQFYDDIFKAVPTRYLHLMIRPDHEPANDNSDPYRPDFPADAFESTRPTIELCAAAKTRRRDMQLYATLYTPPDLIKSASEFWLVMTEAFNQGVNVWMAYDWAYPPRQGGEALTHIEWGKSYHKTKIYHGFSQWCRPLQPGMRVVEPEISGPGAPGGATPGVKSSAFLSRDGRRVVAHVVNLQDKTAGVALRIVGRAFERAPVHTTRTSSDASQAAQRPRRLAGGKLTDTLKPREMVSYVLSR